MRKALIILFFLILAPSVVFAQDKISFTFSTFFPPTYFLITEQIPSYFSMVEKATDGKYKLDIKMFPAEGLTKAADTYDGVAKGIADTGLSSFSYNTGRFPVMLTMNQPGIAPPKNTHAANHAAWEFYSTQKPKELDDIKILFIFGTGPGWVFSNKAIKNVADFKGLRIRVTGTSVSYAKAIGADPIALPMSESYIAAQRGIIDALVNPSQSLNGWKLAEVFKYSTFAPYGYSEFFWVGMNLRKWNSLPKDLQNAFESVAINAVKEAAQMWEYYNKKGLEVGKKQGNTILYLSDEENAKIQDLLINIENEYISYLNNKGFPGEETVKLAKSLIEKYNKLEYEPWKP